jgi:uncharacterized repeat protein (TIGR04052 family)
MRHLWALPLLAACSAGTPVEINFEASFGEVPFACGTPVTGVGATSTTWDPQDLRLYLHDLQLIDEAGEAHALTLDAGNPWQHKDVVLLDFEDDTGACANGTTETNAVAAGTAPERTYTGLRFILGVPFELNHADAAVAASPLNLSTMFWGWEAGYKFLRLEGATTGQPEGMIFHLGSTGCSADEDGVVSECRAPNLAEVELTGFDPTSEAVTLDLAALFEGVDLDTNAPATAGGCMSTPDDPDCAVLFDHLGLPFGEASGGPQTLFRAP